MYIPICWTSYACDNVVHNFMCSCGLLLPFLSTPLPSGLFPVPSRGIQPSFLVNAFPLDMSQYFRLFSSTCSPHQHKDTFQDSRHVVVLRRGHFCKVETLQRDGKGEGGCSILLGGCGDDIIRSARRR